MLATVTLQMPTAYVSCTIFIKNTNSKHVHLYQDHRNLYAEIVHHHRFHCDYSVSHTDASTSGHVLSQQIMTDFPRFQGLMVLKLLTPLLCFSSLTSERWDKPKPNNPLCTECCSPDPCVNRCPQRTMEGNSRMVFSGVMSKCHLTGYSQMTGFTGRKNVIATSLLPSIRGESWGGQIVLKPSVQKH